MQKTHLHTGSPCVGQLFFIFQRNVVAPVVDLSGRSRAAASATTASNSAAANTSSTFLRPHKAIPLGEGPPLSFIPKALKEDKVFLFGEILVEDEYNPTAPSDYAKQKQKLDERKAKEKIAREIAERLNREHQEEIAKREAGAAVAPPKNLMEEDEKVDPSAVAAPGSSENSEMLPPPAFIPSFGAGKGLGVAANIMSKFGYKEGAGLGRSGQGMSTALKVERLGKNSGVIVNEHELNAKGMRFLLLKCVTAEAAAAAAAASTGPAPSFLEVPAANPPPAPAEDVTEALKHSSRILMLRNMVGPEEIDDQLEPEVKDEMKKYGQVNNVIIYRVRLARCRFGLFHRSF
ncbi:unnamed protein product [Gongylonema pulchrum]|uniref:G-patch domain-containing protein n=1 Tax=Gongylonema pulchrum TaxID=637853 RepID=A0A183E7P2_9BILA|nr:unnamed protein product [Gongylonema pulchrum]